MSDKVAAAAWDECLVEVAGPPAGWWYVRPVPRALQQSLGSARFAATSLQHWFKPIARRRMCMSRWSVCWALAPVASAARP